MTTTTTTTCDCCNRTIDGDQDQVVVFVVSDCGRVSQQQHDYHATCWAAMLHAARIGTTAP